MSNIINRTFYTELYRKVQTYGMINTAPARTKSTHTITPKKALNLRFRKMSTEKILSFRWRE